MAYSIDADIPQSFEEFQLNLQKSQVEMLYAVSQLSEIDRAYVFTCIKVSGYLPCFEILKHYRTTYTYEPDERPFTFREIGKPSLGPSPPLH